MALNKDLPPKGAISICELAPSEAAFHIKGWFVPSAIVREITIYNDHGGQLGQATLQCPRPDVLKNYPQYSDNLGGWEMTSSASLPSEGETIHVVVSTKSGETFTYTKKLMVNEEKYQEYKKLLSKLKSSYRVKEGDFLSKTFDPEAIVAQFKESGFNVHKFILDENDFQQWMDKIDYQQNYPNYASDYQQIRKKALGHYLSLKHLGLEQKDTVCLDIGSGTSVFPDIIKRHYGVTAAYRQDLEYPNGLNEEKIGGLAAKVPLPDNSIDYITLHSALENFEGGEDINFFTEAWRLLKCGGKVCISPLYMADEYAIVTSLSVWNSKYKYYNKTSPAFDPKAAIYINEKICQRQWKFFSVPALACEMLNRYKEFFDFEIISYPSAGQALDQQAFSMLLTKRPAPLEKPWTKLVRMITGKGYGENRHDADFARKKQINEYIVGLEQHYKKKRIIYGQSPQSLADAKELYQLISPYKVTGRPKVRVGGSADGGYVMLDPGKNGIAYSFGVSWHSPWDFEMAEKGFKVYQYDGTIEQEPDKHPNIFFHKYNIDSSINPPANCRNITQIIAENGHADEDDIILEMDIERAEWPLFKNITSEQLLKFKQIIVEFHDIYPNSEDFMEKLAVFRKIALTHNSIHVHANNFGAITLFPDFFIVPATLEITFVRKPLPKDGFAFTPCTDVYPTPLDTPNCGKFPDIPFGRFQDLL